MLDSKSWAHGPHHNCDAPGRYMITAGTYLKAHIFKTPTRLDALTQCLLAYSERGRYLLHGWAVFSNHYHFIVTVYENSVPLPEFLQEFHSRSARWVNNLDGTAGRQVWHQFWDKNLTYERSFRARLRYVMNNPVKHRLVDHAREYPWCSAKTAEQTWDGAYYRSVQSFKIDKLDIYDEF